MKRRVALSFLVVAILAIIPLSSFSATPNTKEKRIVELNINICEGKSSIGNPIISVEDGTEGKMVLATDPLPESTKSERTPDLTFIATPTIQEDGRIFIKIKVILAFGKETSGLLDTQRLLDQGATTELGEICIRDEAAKKIRCYKVSLLTKVFSETVNK